MKLPYCVLFRRSYHRLPVFFAPIYTIEMPAGHRFPMSELKRRGVDRYANFIQPVPVPPKLVMLAHSADYLHRYLSSGLSKKHLTQLGLPWSPRLAVRALHICGGTVAATKYVLDRLGTENNVAANLGGGSHHSKYNQPSGFCSFNDIAVATRYALSPLRRALDLQPSLSCIPRPAGGATGSEAVGNQEEDAAMDGVMPAVELVHPTCEAPLVEQIEAQYVQHMNSVSKEFGFQFRGIPEVSPPKHFAERVLIIDLDVHQGDGTALILRHEPRAFTLSVHAARCFPFRKARSSMDVELEDGTTDAPFLDACDRAIQKALEIHRPQLVIFQAGVDPLVGDSLGRLAISREGLQKRNELVFQRCWEFDKRTGIVVTMGGGYHRPLDASIAAHADVYMSAAFAASQSDTVY
eukprot:ANDGO_03128.mRNA.2 Uncharacterized protein SYNPCC7002_A1628